MENETIEELQKRLKYFHLRVVDQITEPTDFWFIKNEDTGYLIKLTGGHVTLCNNKGFRVSMPPHYMFEIIEKHIKEKYPLKEKTDLPPQH